MSNRRVISTGRRDFPREMWGPGDFEAEQREWERLEGPLLHVPGGPPPEVKFSLFEPPITGGVRSKAIDEAIAKHTGRRYRGSSGTSDASSSSAAVIFLVDG